jgi:hypothetical protein
MGVNGKMATGNLTNGSNFIDGTSVSESIDGSSDSDCIRGFDGRDRIRGFAANDIINGNQGNDSINGNQGEDTLYGGRGNDTIHGGRGNDLIFGNLGDDVLFGDRGTDSLSGGDGADAFVIGDGTGGGTIAAADVITDFRQGTDKLWLMPDLDPVNTVDVVLNNAFNNLIFDRMDGNTIITAKDTGERLAVLQGFTNGLSINDFEIARIPGARISPGTDTGNGSGGGTTDDGATDDSNGGGTFDGGTGGGTGNGRDFSGEDDIDTDNGTSGGSGGETGGGSGTNGGGNGDDVQPPPIVSIAATDDSASEAGDTATFTISRTGIISEELEVNLAISGSAGNGVDYDTIADTVTIPVQASSIDIELVPIDDAEADEGTEDVTIAIADGENYDVSSSGSSATIDIVDNDAVGSSVAALTDASERIIGTILGDTLEGLGGSDYLEGDAGDDILTGTSPNSISGVVEVDTLIGGAGEDIFVLGDSDRIYYSDENINSGLESYAMLMDFNLDEDFIQLNAEGVYHLDELHASWRSLGTGYIHDSMSEHVGLFTSDNDLIALLQGVTMDDAGAIADRFILL